MRHGIFFGRLVLGDIKKACQPANIFGININGIGNLAAMATTLALKIHLDLDSQIIIWL
jgi:hypothetical protein